MWNEVEHLGTDHSKDEHVANLIQIAKGLNVPHFDSCFC